MAAAELNLDLSQPLAILVREQTRDRHERARTDPGAQLLVNGQLPKKQYTQYLMMLWHMYDALETALDQHSTHPTLEPTYSPALLRRTAALTSDISFFLQVPPSEWQCHPLHTSLLASMPKELRAYLDRIKLITNSEDPSRLLAHTYVRYLGDMLGGQFIRRVAVKAYGLDEATSSGVELYNFKGLGSSNEANQGDLNKIREWFKDGMNKGGERNEAAKAAVVNEAFVAYDLNMGILTVLASLVVDSKEGQCVTQTTPKVYKYNPDRAYALISVAALVTAACLVHFVLVPGGFTGAKEHWHFLPSLPSLSPY